MSDSKTIATCTIEFWAQHPKGAGFYYQLEDPAEPATVRDRIEEFGPFATQELAEMDFLQALTEAMIETVEKDLQL